MSVWFDNSLMDGSVRRWSKCFQCCASALLLIGIITVQSTAQYKNSLLSPSSYSLQDNRYSISVYDTTKIDSGGVAIAYKSGTKALLLSAILPGAGQIYTERYWKVPIIIGFGGYFISQIIRAQDLYQSAKVKYSESIQKDERGNPQYLFERDFYHDERDRFSLYLALTYILNLVDAYVGASLYNFDVSSDLGGTVALKLRLPLR
ncbi:MAG: DUF5683 domain-containing protein [bacterium]